MQGAVVCSMLRSSRKGRRKITAEEVNSLLNEPVTSLFEDMDQVDSVIKGRRPSERSRSRGCLRRCERRWAGQARTCDS